MQFSTITTLLSAIATVNAAVHTVTVGNGGLVFSPNNLTAAAGDTVVFSFYPSKHSVAQATFAKPCVPMDSSSFFSGAMATTSGVNANTYTLTINDTTPIWFYCSVATHCESGMVGSINAATTGAKTITAFIAAAKNATNTTIPATVQGGVIAASSSTNSSSNATSAGVESHGSVQWMTLAFTGLMAVGFGGLIV